MNDFTEFVAALIGAPHLPGARCRGRAHLFDEKGPHEGNATAAARHAQAVGLCRHCPSLDACREWVDGLPRSKRPVGVIAGRKASGLMNIDDSQARP